MPLYSWGKKWAKILVSNVSQSTLTRAFRIGLFPSSSICHFLNLKLKSLAVPERGSVEATAPWWPPTPSHQTFFARMAFTTRGIHAAGNHTNMESTQQPSTKQRFETQDWFMSSLMSLLCSSIIRQAQNFDQSIGRPADKFMSRKALSTCSLWCSSTACTARRKNKLRLLSIRWKTHIWSMLARAFLFDLSLVSVWTRGAMRKSWKVWTTCQVKLP